MALATEVNTDATGVVIRGYDPVAYFTEGRPVPGRPDIYGEYGGGKYLFATPENFDAFNTNPEAYVPQYGGFCAFGISMAKKFDIDPASWKIVDKKLYLNLNSAIHLAMVYKCARLYSDSGKELAASPYTSSFRALNVSMRIERAECFHRTGLSG